MEDLRDSKKPRLLVRTADESKKDKKGKYNDWTGRKEYLSTQ